MDGQNEQTIAQPVAPQAGAPAVPPQPLKSMDKKKILMFGIGAIVLLLILLILLSVTKKKPYAFTIETEVIPQTTVQDMYSYYIKQPGYDRQKALKTITALFEEHHVLATTYQTAKLSDNLLQQKKAALAAKEHTSVPDSIQTVAIENTAMRELLTQQLGVTERSGDAFIILANGLSPDIQATTEAVMRKELQAAKTAIDIGSSYDQVQNTFLQDQTIITNSALTSRVFPFVDMTPDHPFIPSEDFVKTVFATENGKTSDIFSVSYNGILYDGFVYITNATNGDINNYAKWLAEKELKLQMTADFSAIH